MSWSWLFFLYCLASENTVQGQFLLQANPINNNNNDNNNGNTDGSGSGGNDQSLTTQLRPGEERGRIQFFFTSTNNNSNGNPSIRGGGTGNNDEPQPEPQPEPLPEPQPEQQSEQPEPQPEQLATNSGISTAVDDPQTVNGISSPTERLDNATISNVDDPTTAIVVPTVTDRIQTVQSCFKLGENILVEFINGNNPQITDWIGLYPAPFITQLDQLPSPPQERWVWTCGTQICSGLSGERVGRVSIPGAFLDPAFGLHRATLGVGEWIAVLAQDNTVSPSGPFRGKVATSIFTVQMECPDTTTTINEPTTSENNGSTPNVTTTSNNDNTETNGNDIRSDEQTTPGNRNDILDGSIGVNKLFFAFDEPIQVDFTNLNPLPDDWIGIYRADIPPTSLGDNGEIWQWTCGGQSQDACFQPFRRGTISFRSGSLSSLAGEWNQIMPLVGGQYRAYLLRNTNAPFTVVAQSPIFEIEEGEEILISQVNAVRRDIQRLIAQDIKLAAKFLRLVFHDCVGGCDGCVDMMLPDNFGLEVPIAALAPVVARHEDGRLSRADIWMLAGVVGADVSQEGSAFERISFPFQSFGRVNCEDALLICRDRFGSSVPCGPSRGPHREIPGMNTGTQELFHFFAHEFRFNQRETIAIMGAHTLGELSRKNSGIDGPNGWLLNNTVLDNEYYAELVGGSSPNDPVGVLVHNAPGWRRDVEDNRDLVGMSSKHVWTGFPGGTKIVMLNVDVAIVRHLDPRFNMDPQGRVTCAFRHANVCPHARGALRQAAIYKNDNNLWLRDFRDVLTRMVMNGYQQARNCRPGRVCKLLEIRSTFFAS